MSDSKQRIVVVEDDTGMRRALQRLLHVSGFDTLLFDSAEALMSANGAVGAHCLVLDVQLPGASGPTLYQQLGDERPPAVFISSRDNPAMRAALWRAGGHELLIKPFVGKDILAAIGRAMLRPRE